MSVYPTHVLGQELWPVSNWSTISDVIAKVVGLDLCVKGKFLCATTILAKMVEYVPSNLVEVEKIEWMSEYARAKLGKKFIQDDYTNNKIY